MSVSSVLLGVRERSFRGRQSRSQPGCNTHLCSSWPSINAVVMRRRTMVTGARHASTKKRCIHTKGSGATSGVLEITQSTNKTDHEPVDWTPETTINNTPEAGRRAETLASQMRRNVPSILVAAEFPTGVGDDNCAGTAHHRQHGATRGGEG
jgi:hypothetical protein